VSINSTVLKGSRCTWAHISHSANRVLLAVLVSRRKPKVCEEDLRPVLITKDVKGFQVAMIDVVRVAVVHGVDDLEKRRLDPR